MNEHAAAPSARTAGETHGGGPVWVKRGKRSGPIDRATGSDTAVFLNRLTPASYPATLKTVQNYFGNRTDGLKAGTAIQVIAATIRAVPRLSRCSRREY